MVASAYEYSYQLNGVSCPGTSFGTYPSSFCFPPDAANRPNCVATTFNSTGYVCIDLVAGPVIAATEDGGQQYVFTGFVPKNKDSWVDLFIPKAFADINTPPPPTGLTHNLNPSSCPASPLCRKCGPGEAHICVEIKFCPSDKATCSGTEQVKLDMMIQRF
jgi:hypothetical protein